MDPENWTRKRDIVSYALVIMNDAGPVWDNVGCAGRKQYQHRATYEKGWYRGVCHEIHFDLNVANDDIAVTIGDARGGEARYYGTIPHTDKAVRKLMKSIESP